MEPAQSPPLRFLHSEDVLSSLKLEKLRHLSTEALIASLQPGQPGALKVRPDGTVLDGHHRLFVLVERSEEIHRLPREILEKET
jgi:hypothetical protein